MRAGSWCCAVLLLASVTVSCVEVTKAPSIQKIESLNRDAIAAYQKGKPEDARRKLIQALAVADRDGLESHRAAAQSHLDLGAVYATGLKQRSKGVAQMTEALTLHSGLELPPELAKPAAKRAYAVAAKAAQKRVAAQDAKAAVASDKAAKSEKSESTPKTETAKPSDKHEATVPPPPIAKADGGDVKPTTVSPKPRITDGEPDLPRDYPQAIVCPGPDEVPPDHDVPVLCALDPKIHAAKMNLFWRAPDREDYASVAMTKTPHGWWAATIPGGDVKGKMVQHYVEAEGANKKTFAASGDPVSPNLFLVRGSAPEVNVADLANATRKDDSDDNAPGSAQEDPLAMAAHDTAPARETWQAGTWFVGLGVGTGVGWHPGGKLENRNDLSVSSGFDGANRFHLLPEVGYLWTDSVAFSIETRHQFIPTTGQATAQQSTPATSATAVMARAWLFLLDGHFRLFGNLSVGGGSAFRLVVVEQPTAGLAQNDTIRGGPFVIGPAVGATVRVGHVALLVETRGLIGAPSFAAVGEVNGALQVGF